MEEATFLTRFAKSVTVIHRRDQLNASKIMQERAKKNPKIDFIWNTDVTEVLGETRVSGIKLKNNQTGEEQKLDGEGIFLAIGHIPNTEIFQDKLELDKHGYLKTNNFTLTSVAGVFSGGDVWDYRYRQAITAAGMGCMAAMDAEKYLSLQE